MPRSVSVVINATASKPTKVKKNIPIKKKSNHPRHKPRKKKTQVVKIDGEKSIRFTKGTLRRSLGLTKADAALTRAELARLKDLELGTKFDFRGKNKKMTKLMKSRVSLGLTLIKFN